MSELVKEKKPRNPVKLWDRIMDPVKLEPLIHAAPVEDRAALVDRAELVVRMVRDSLKESPAQKTLREKLGG